MEREQKRKKSFPHQETTSTQESKHEETRKIALGRNRSVSKDFLQIPCAHRLVRRRYLQELHLATSARPRQRPVGKLNRGSLRSRQEVAVLAPGDETWPGARAPPLPAGAGTRRSPRSMGKLGRGSRAASPCRSSPRPRPAAKLDRGATCRRSLLEQVLGMAYARAGKLD
jgi:hypothetical protein